MNPPVPRSSAGVCAATKYRRSPWDPTRPGNAPAKASAAVAVPAASSSWAIDRSRASATGPTIQDVGSDLTPARAVSSLTRASLIAGRNASIRSTGSVPLEGASSAIPSGSSWIPSDRSEPAEAASRPASASMTTASKERPARGTDPARRRTGSSSRSRPPRRTRPPLGRTRWTALRGPPTAAALGRSRARLGP